MMAATERGWKVALPDVLDCPGLFFIPAFLCYISYVFPAWAANILSREPWQGSFRVTDVKARSGPVWRLYYEAYLTETSSGQEQYFRC